MFVVVQNEAAATLTLIAAECVDTVLLAAAIILGALILVCRGANKGRPRVCAGQRSATPQGKEGAWLGFLPPGESNSSRRCGQWEAKAVGIWGSASNGTS